MIVVFRWPLKLCFCSMYYCDVLCMYSCVFYVLNSFIVVYVFIFYFNFLMVAQLWFLLNAFVIVGAFVFVCSICLNRFQCVLDFIWPLFSVVCVTLLIFVPNSVLWCLMCFLFLFYSCAYYELKGSSLYLLYTSLVLLNFAFFTFLLCCCVVVVRSLCFKRVHCFFYIYDVCFLICA